MASSSSISIAACLVLLAVNRSCLVPHAMWFVAIGLVALTAGAFAFVSDSLVSVFELNFNFNVQHAR